MGLAARQQEFRMNQAADLQEKTVRGGLNDLIAASYDTTPYDSFPFPQSAPEHLQSVARLFGLNTPSPAKARILELGCAAGGNLIPLARRHPQAQLLGVDLSSVQIEHGRAVIRDNQLKSIELRVGSIADIDASWGRFDYIICHGVYSWVPPEIQQAVLKVCEQCLSEDGVAYISYNTYPGWKFREVLRDAMMLRGTTRGTPAEQLSYARGMLDFLQQKAAPGSALKAALDENMPHIQQSAAYYLMHEFLEPCNAPCYFKDFLQAANLQGLSYLAEADISPMFASNHPSEIAEPLKREVRLQVEFEQYLDFVANRSFRQTLLVRSERQGAINYQMEAARLHTLNFAGLFNRSPTPNPSSDGSVSYTAWRNQSVVLSTPLSQAIAQVLDGAYPGTRSIRQLANAVAAKTKQTASELLDPVTAVMEELTIKGYVRFRAEPLNCGGPLPARPARSPEVHVWRLPPTVADGLPRLFACNPWHEICSLTMVEWHLLALTDGRRDHAALLVALQALMQQGELGFLRDGARVEDPVSLAELCRSHMQSGLANLARLGMFLPDKSARAG
jgi:methyltransferase-like protein/2-polyprenyl-3-methyl-5-hydroxy-6-metoxy-1,4-benzoquinol methylase